MTKANEPVNCRKDAGSILNHNKGIFHLKQCPNCYSSETIEPEKERRVLAGQAMMGLAANSSVMHYNPEQVAEYSVKYADALISELEKINQP